MLLFVKWNVKWVTLFFIYLLKFLNLFNLLKCFPAWTSDKYYTAVLVLFHHYFLPAVIVALTAAFKAVALCIFDIYTIFNIIIK